MRYESINPNLFSTNRTKLIDLLPTDAIAIFNSNDIMPTNADGEMGFRQNNDLLYLTGIDQEESTLIVLKRNNLATFHLFLKETSDLIKIWEGAKLTIEEAQKVSLIKDVQWNDRLLPFLSENVKGDEIYFYNSNEHGRSASSVETRDDRFNLNFKKTNPDLKLEKAAPLMHQLRQVKSQTEIDLIQKACSITESAYRRLLGYIKPGMSEFEVEAEITYDFLKSRSRGHAYAPIVAGGANACILHYTSNNDVLKSGDVILMDFGAEYANYASDMTRSIPVSGTFTKRQKQVYNAVLDSLKFAKTQLVPGNTIAKYQKEVSLHIEKHLVDLGLISLQEIKDQDPKSPAFRKFFMHGVSHSLGLDVHDVDNRERPFENGMVYTIEPGIYIPDENLGIRLENNFVINDNNPIDLMANIPIEADEIEELMNR